MKKLGIVLLLLFTIFTLASCGDGVEVPDGMQLVYGSEAEGYYFFAPEEWTVSNVGEIKSAYVSTLDTTSVSFAEVHPEKTNKGDKDTESYFFEDYFSDSLAEFPNEPQEIKGPSDYVFGKEGETAERACSYTYSYEYSGHTFGFLQILIKNCDKYYIFTYTALLESKNGGATYYDHYFEEKLISIIESFRFLESSGASNQENKPEYTKDNDGYLLISDPALAGFELYVPEEFVPDYLSAIISATHQDGSNITMSKATATGIDIEAYWTTRKQELSAVVKNLTVIKDIHRDQTVQMGNASYAFECEYTYEYNQTTYHVYQILCVDKAFLGNGYVFTYTATKENYEKHLPKITNVVNKVRF